ncbi:hypothetical protein [Streptomyces sp. SID14515]|uniref:hypothetical protein n=1 Tax=Streptomyces sp. SID14515 TaxID=2706074 RepID=UPI0013C7F903|nr:hypothetical protein [Streptomyces sp. SID14515]NEB42312.1 hypothetical protein [Streptomyces sp. SID14515]
MTRRPPLNCALCAVPIWGDPPTVWSDEPDREPFCGDDCLATATAVARSVPPAVDRGVRRDHSLCGASPCSHCR